MSTRVLPDTLRGQLLVGFFLLYLLVTVPLVLFLTEFAQDRIETEKQEQFEQRAKLSSAALALALTEDGSRVSQDQLDQMALASGLSLALFADGTLLSSGVDPDEIDSTAFPLDDLNNARGEIEFMDGRAWYLTPLPGMDGISLLAATDADALQAPFRGIWSTAAITTILATLIFSIGGWILARQSSAPLVSLRDHALAAAAGDIGGVDATAGTRAVRDLASVVNLMTDRNRALTAGIEHSRRRLELIFEHLREGVLVVDDTEAVIAENPRAREILGNHGRSGIGLAFAVVVRDHDLLDHMRTAIRQLQPSTIPVDYARSGRSIEATAIPMEGESGTFCVVVLRDVTEIRRLELVRREFVANVSHELRTPLASIRALADTLESGAIDDRTVAIDFLQRIAGEVDRLTALVEELLDLARLESGRVNLARKPVESADVVSAGVERLRPQIDRAGLTLDILLEGELPVVSVDQQRIEQVLINLLHNAVKFTPPGGRIEVVARAANDGLQVDVKDSGSGIPEDELNRVFERFYKADRSRRSEGSGLGLAISKHIIKAHQGDLWARSKVGEGSVFSFWIPAANRSPLLPGRERTATGIGSGPSAGAVIAGE